MQINENLCNNAYRKIAKILTKAADLGMDLSGYGEASENTTSGHVYLWLEDYNFTLFISLGSDEVQALWTSPDEGEEIEIPVGDLTLAQLEQWTWDSDKQAEKVISCY
jgi:hypothetical protein